MATSASPMKTANNKICPPDQQHRSEADRSAHDESEGGKETVVIPSIGHTIHYDQAMQASQTDRSHRCHTDGNTHTEQMANGISSNIINLVSSHHQMPSPSLSSAPNDCSEEKVRDSQPLSPIVVFNDKGAASDKKE